MASSMDPQTIQFCGPFPQLCGPCYTTDPNLPPAPPPRPCGHIIMMNTPVAKCDGLTFGGYSHRAEEDTNNSTSDRGDQGDSGERTKKKRRASSRELRAGVNYTGCDCEKLNGLQDRCRRSGCHGTPDCTSRPTSCFPSEFSNAKHLVRIADANRAKRKRI